MEKQERSSFSSRVGFVLAASGSAVGLGNLWRFPYLAARYGGGIFLLVYLILVVTFGFSLMITEFAIGRKTKLSCIGAYGALDKRFSFLGWIAAFVPLIITPYYCVIGGWVMKYLWTFISGGALEAADNGGFFSRFISFDAGSLPATMLNFSGPTPWFVLFVLITGLVVIFGVQKGIENASRLMMPVLAVLIVVIALFADHPGRSGWRQVLSDAGFLAVLGLYRARRVRPDVLLYVARDGHHDHLRLVYAEGKPA